MCLKKFMAVTAGGGGGGQCYAISNVYLSPALTLSLGSLKLDRVRGGTMHPMRHRG